MLSLYVWKLTCAHNHYVYGGDIWGVYGVPRCVEEGASVRLSEILCGGSLINMCGGLQGSGGWILALFGQDAVYVCLTFHPKTFLCCRKVMLSIEWIHHRTKQLWGRMCSRSCGFQYHMTVLTIISYWCCLWSLPAACNKGCCGHYGIDLPPVLSQGVYNMFTWLIQSARGMKSHCTGCAPPLRSPLRPSFTVLIGCSPVSI